MYIDVAACDLPALAVLAPGNQCCSHRFSLDHSHLHMLCSQYPIVFVPFSPYHVVEAIRIAMPLMAALLLDKSQTATTRGSNFEQ